MTSTTPMRRSLAIQMRVIGALLMREIIIRYGRHNIGFLWLFVESMLFTLGVITLWTFTKATHGSHLPITAFAVTGYSSVLLWRNMPSRCADAIKPNLALIYHRHVKIIDIFASRILKERGIQAKLVDDLSSRYFLMPLQVHNDAQIHTHSDFASVKAFIRSSIHSFARHAPADTLLVIKHHPMDRGYHDYTRFIAMVVRSNRVADWVLYIHDLHLPTLLQYARGAVLVNSMVRLSALHHGTPIKICGSAIYDMGGLAYQGLLKDFWAHATSNMVDKELFARFQNYLIEFTQLNGNFYKRLAIPRSHAGLRWGDRSKASLEARVASCDLVPAIEKAVPPEKSAAA